MEFRCTEFCFPCPFVSSKLIETVGWGSVCERAVGRAFRRKKTNEPTVRGFCQYLLSLDQNSSRASHEALKELSIDSGERSGELCRSSIEVNLNEPQFQLYYRRISCISNLCTHGLALLRASPILSRAVAFQGCYEWEAPYYNFDCM
jgi:hypothetical protein